MKSGILPLPTEVVHLIAAGEVIDSLAAVVRELAENSLDAGATRVVIYLYPQQWRVRIADNGCGMDLENLQACATAHSTSKIRSCEDLWQVTSLGFRGEALHSLAQLAELEIFSRAAETGEGWRVRYCDRGEAIETETVAIAPGTVVTVSNLFATWAERRQGMPSLSQQIRAIQNTIQQIALCHPHVTWQVWQNDREWFTLSPGATTQHLIPQILRQVSLSDLQYLKVEVPTPFEGAGNREQGAGSREQGAGEQGSRGNKRAEGAEGAEEENNINSTPRTTHHDAALLRRTPPQPPASPRTTSSSLQLVLGLPDRCHRHRPDWVRVAVNGRMVKFAQLEQTIFAAMTRTLPRDRYPVCFLHLRVAPWQIDWNRQPAKTEIYLHHLSHWQEHTAGAIEQILRLNSNSVSDSAHNTRVTQLIKVAEEKGVYSTSQAIAQGDKGDKEDKEDKGDKEVEEGSTLHPTPHTLHPFLKAIAQVHNMYILVEHPGGMWLVEQHIAHERVLYEQLCDRWQLVPLEPPVILNHLSLAQIAQLQRLNLEVEPFGDRLWAVRSAPAMLVQRDDCADALVELSLGGDLQAAQVATACRCAIRNGTTLSLEEMQTLLNQWQRTRNPRTCPHGRPIYLSLEESALSRFFRRHWMIGKSHGI
ncbi:DNA mismatch repair endonuclease MutL [Chroococcidiopsis sp. FACHB-1243]|uniref:DNA mismatch repair endonuclease MutL n=1 Tax=Chroococcidiopsis sp. [FACHB-1243] TaxID=2692781 RepID=UPI0017821D36|nr:DNA mismatch repair endonuclease MutL [Chroococcidiopsis sp. [FACHB-1243]]MBD2309234.1 DNA mismatch repair endonuclease MutL [Chroococcidiopsis sp. [FACHB-1243]]